MEALILSNSVQAQLECIDYEHYCSLCIQTTECGRWAVAITLVVEIFFYKICENTTLIIQKCGVGKHCVFNIIIRLDFNKKHNGNCVKYCVVYLYFDVAIMANIGDVIENQTSNAASNNYVTVIPVDYSTNLIYNSQTPDYIVEQYRSVYL